MRFHLLSFLSGCCGLLFTGAVQALPAGYITSTSLIAAPIDKIFAPQGFDDNDNAEVVLHGQFPNACYKTGPAMASLDKSTNTITIDPKSYLTEAVLCAEVLIKFIQPVQLGVLPKGTYTVVVKDRPKVAPVKLEIVGARSSSRDDALYAPVDVVSIDVDNAGHDILRLEGDYPYMLVGCLVGEDVRTEFAPSDVLVVRPVSSLIDTDACASQRKHNRFTLTKDLGVHRVVGEDYLIHVRTLNGTAVNRLVESYPDQ